MQRDAPPEAVAEHLRRIAQMEADVAQRLDRVPNAVVSGQLSRMQSLAERHHETLRQLGEIRGVSLLASRQGAKAAALSPTAGLEQTVTATASLAAAYAVLYATARLLFEGDVCDVANRHGSEWVAELRTASGLLPVAAIDELVADGEVCRCICPACGIGACLCMRNSIDTVREHWGQPGLEPAEGIELRIPPRAGSQLADAGLQAGDRVVAIDDEVVHDNRELQQALRRAGIGEPRRARVIQNDTERELPVARVSDLP